MIQKLTKFVLFASCFLITLIIPTYAYAVVTLEFMKPSGSPPEIAFTINKGSSITVGDKVPIVVSITPNAAVSKIEFFVDNSLKQATTANSYTWNTSYTSPGDHAIKIKVTDKNGHIIVSTQTITVYRPSALRVALTINKGNSISAGDKVPIEATIIPSTGISKIEFFVDNSLKQATTTKSYIWDTTYTGPGNHIIKVKVTDHNGQIKLSTQTITVNKPSALRIALTINKGSSISVGDKVPIEATVTPNAGISKIEFFVDNSLKQAITAQSYIWNTSYTSPGNHTIKVKVTDQNGGIKLSSQTIIVNKSSALRVALTINKGSSISVGDKVPIEATITPNSGISKIEFFMDNSLKQAATAQSYIWDTSYTSPGNHFIKVKAIDQNGQIIVSTCTFAVNK